MYKIHPIVVGTKVFDKSMMTYQYGTGQKYTIPINCWYLEGGDRKILVDTGEMNPIQSENRESSIGGKIYTFEEGLARWDISPPDIDMIIHTHLHNDHCENDYKWIYKQSQKSNPAIFGRDLILRSAIKDLRLNGRYFSYFLMLGASIFILCIILVFAFDLNHFFFLFRISVPVCEKYN